MAKSWSTWTNDRSASRILSLQTTSLSGVELEIGARERGVREGGVREKGGLRAGKAWSTGVPYWSGGFREWWTALGGTDEEIGGTNSEDEEVDAKKVEGFTRLMSWLPIWIVSLELRGELDIEVEWEANGTCTVDTADNKPLGAVEVTVAEFPVTFEVCNNWIKKNFLSHRYHII